MEEVVEVERICDETCEPPPVEKPAEAAVAKQERKSFDNQPFKKLENLDLF
jgi:hypothetical protein